MSMLNWIHAQRRALRALVLAGVALAFPAQALAGLALRDEEGGWDYAICCLQSPELELNYIGESDWFTTTGGYVAARKYSNGNVSWSSWKPYGGIEEFGTEGNALRSTILYWGESWSDSTWSVAEYYYT